MIFFNTYQNLTGRVW